MAIDYKKVFNLSLKDSLKCDKVFKALSNKRRRDILNLLSKKGPSSIKNIAFELDAPLSSVSEDVSILLKTGLISVIKDSNSSGQGKIVSRQFEEIHINLTKNNPIYPHHNEIVDILIGSYKNFKVNKLCGMISEEGYIGERDNINCFYESDRFKAQLIWFDYGYLEYEIPIKSKNVDEIQSISFSLELCSESPGYNHNWPSDIFFEVNGIDIGYFTSIGDFGDRAGKYTPFWWKGNTSYGILENVKITEEGSFINEIKVSNVTLKDLKLNEKDTITFKLGVKENAKNRGGLNLFGSKFGDYNQHIVMIIQKKGSNY